MEQHSTSLDSLMIVVAIAFIVPIVLHRLRLKMIPVVVAEIVAGLIIGKSGFNLIQEDPWLELLSLFGFIFLMFLSGLEIDFASFRSNTRASKAAKIHPVKAAFVIFALIFIMSCGLSLLLTWIGVISDPFLMTLIISTISLGVVVPVLKENKIIDSPIGQTILLIAVISDLVTMVLLAVYISFISANASEMWLILIFFAAVVGIYFIARRYVADRVFKVLQKGTVQIGTRAVFALILLFVVISESLNVETILGAFLAGVIVSLLAPNKEFVKQLDSFGYGFLIPIFFVMVGVNMDLLDLFTDLEMLLLIPLLLLAIYVSKMVPALLLKRWYSWREVAGSGMLLSSTLSLVIAAATVAYEVDIISQSMQGALIFVAVLTCIISPIFFSQWFPKQEKKRVKVSMIGANHMTLPIFQELTGEGYEIHLYSASKQPDSPPKEAEGSRLIKVESLEIAELESAEAFAADIVVFGTMDDETNILLAKHAHASGVERVIVRIESHELHERLKNQYPFAFFSTLFASKTLLKALIEYPSAVKLMTQNDESIQEVVVNNAHYDFILLRQLPFLGETLVLRIYRGDSFIIPHGDTAIRVGDRLLVSGPGEHILNMKDKLQ